VLEDLIPLLLTMVCLTLLEVRRRPCLPIVIVVAVAGDEHEGFDVGNSADIHFTRSAKKFVDDHRQEQSNPRCRLVPVVVATREQ
jgi:hypothetical protein